jgi:sulfite reductase (NADPH) hemoprotein beta-component
MTPNQNLVVADVPAAQRARIDALVAQHGLDAGNRAATALARAAMACGPAHLRAGDGRSRTPPPAFTAHLQPLLEKHGLTDAPIRCASAAAPTAARARIWPRSRWSARHRAATT